MSTDANVRDILEHSPTVAVVGIHRAVEKPAFYVPEYLHDHGYRVIGVNPVFAGETLFGETVHATLAELTEPIDLTALPFGSAAGQAPVPAIDLTALPFGRAAGQAPVPAIDLTALPFGRAAGQAPVPAIDLIVMFRRSEAIPAHLDDILAMRPLPKVVWFQLGITNDAAAAVLERAGITVIQNRCMLADHRRLGLGAPGRAS